MFAVVEGRDASILHRIFILPHAVILFPPTFCSGASDRYNSRRRAGVLPKVDF